MGRIVLKSEVSVDADASMDTMIYGLKIAPFVSDMSMTDDKDFFYRSSLADGSTIRDLSVDGGDF